MTWRGNWRACSSIAARTSAEVCGPVRAGPESQPADRQTSATGTKKIIVATATAARRTRRIMTGRESMLEDTPRASTRAGRQTAFLSVVAALRSRIQRNRRQSSMSTAAQQEKVPFFQRGNYAPVADEQSVFSLEVHGAIPPALCGRYLRNGPNPKNEMPPHWFFGDGMIHGVALDGGRALWYRNRWIRTRQLIERARAIGPDGTRDLTAGPANTNIVRHAGRTLAVSETTMPWEVDGNLETIGRCDFGGRLATGMTAHPKICAATGEMHFFDYGFLAPFLTYHCVSKDGELIRSVPIDVPGPT